MPNYMREMSANIRAAIEAAEQAAATIEASTEYNDVRHVFHAGAVANYNRLVSILLNLDGMEV